MDEIITEISVECFPQEILQDAVFRVQHDLALNPGNPLILNNLGNALLALDRREEANEAYQRAIAADPAYPKPYCNLAVLYQLEGRSGEAIEAYRLYLNIAPEDGEAHYNLGLLYMAEGQADAARTAFRLAAQQLVPDNAECATNLGVSCFFLGDLEKAVTLFEQALALDAAYLPARYHLGVAYLCQGRCTESIEMLEVVIAADPDYPQAAANLGVAYNTDGQPARAITIFEELLQQDPDNPSLNLNLGYACWDAGFTERALTCFERVIAVSAMESTDAQKARHALTAILTATQAPVRTGVPDMPRSKTLVEVAEKPAPSPAVDDKHETPDKKDGPHTAQATAAEAADLLQEEKPAATATARARTVAALQRKLGNTRLAKMLGKAPAAEAHEKEKSVAEHGPTPAMPPAQQKKEESSHAQPGEHH
jgi:tetratricopeptide (TPR) repeat protein